MSSRESGIGLGPSITPILTLLVCMVVGARRFGLDTEILIASMLVAATTAGVIALFHGASWQDIQDSTGEKFAAVLPVVLILLAIGMLIGTWVYSGTIPWLVSWGILRIEPRFFVITAFLVTALMSLCTGTSWGSAGTLGVALMGTAVALEAPLGAAAGAVVSGAYFGDKLSPLSDSTNICALGAGADLYAHIRHMLYTALPSFVLALLVYGLVAGSGVAIDGALPVAARELLADLELGFRLDAWAALPLVVVVVGVLARRPPALVLAASSVVAIALGVAVQGFGLGEGIRAAISGFEAEMTAGEGELFVRLVSRGGLFSMAQTLIVILAAFLLAATMEVSGALDRILAALLSSVRSVFGLVAATMAAGATLISLTSHGGVTALIVGGMFQSAYRERRLAPENLSRSLEDSVTLLEPLLPWTVSAIFMSTTLGVPTLDYLPWAIFCLGGPAFSLLYALAFTRTGIGIREISDGAPVR